jgi:hypothetical protein
MTNRVLSSQSSDAARSAFTLTELAVVVACVALLIAILDPSLEAARESSKHATCMDRLRAIGDATTTYSADDPDGWALPVHPAQFPENPAYPVFVGAYEWGGKSGVGRPGWVEGPDDPPYLTSKYGTKAGFGPATRPLNTVLYPYGFRDNLSFGFDPIGAELDTRLRLDAYQCPADDGPPAGAHCPDWVGNPERSSYDHFGTSYAGNIFMTAPSAGGEMTSNSPYLRPVSRISTPARTINYEENIGRWAWACRREIEECTWIGPGVYPGITKAVRGWHGKNWTYNRVFVDAHAERQAVFIEGTEDADGYSNHYYNELVFEDPSEQNNYRCVIVRGDGWQKDTLPDLPIPTGRYWSGDGRPSYEDCVD